MFGLFKKQKDINNGKYQKIIDSGAYYFGPFNNFVKDFVDLKCGDCDSDVPSISINNSIIYEEPFGYCLKCSTCRGVGEVVDHDYILSREAIIQSIRSDHPHSVDRDKRIAAVVFAEEQIFKYGESNFHGYPWINLLMFFRFFPDGFKENANYKNPCWNAVKDQKGLEWVQYYHSYQNTEILGYCPECSNHLYLDDDSSHYAYGNARFRSIEWLIRETPRGTDAWAEMIHGVFDDSNDDFGHLEYNSPSDISFNNHESYSQEEVKCKKRELAEKVICCVDSKICFYCRLPYSKRWNYLASFKSDLEDLHKSDLEHESKRKWHKEYLEYIERLNLTVGRWADYGDVNDEGEFGSFQLPDLLSMIDQPPYLD